VEELHSIVKKGQRDMKKSDKVNFLKAKIVKKLLEFFGEDFRRIEHALSALKHAEQIAEAYSGLDYDVLIASAILHDVGIKPSEEKLGYNNGDTQEKYGPIEAEKLLLEISFPNDKIKKVCEIIGNHHSKSRYDYPELAILKEADAIVNKLEMAERKKGD
jgi:HD superfamily phosphodiesterase